MSHFFVVVLVPEDTEDIESAVGELLAPYDENTEVDPYHDYLSAESIERMAAHYKKDPNDLDALVACIEDWTGTPGDRDTTGLYRTSTYNPQSQWDWWCIGGRWNGEIQNERRSDDTGFNFDDEYHQLNENMLPTKKLDHKLTCFAMVTPDGVWHQRGKMGWWASVSDEKDQAEWEEELIKLIQANQDTILVGVDCHI